MWSQTQAAAIVQKGLPAILAENLFQCQHLDMFCCCMFWLSGAILVICALQVAFRSELQGAQE